MEYETLGRPATCQLITINSRRHQEKEWLAIRPVNDRFQESSDYWTYLFVDKSSHYDEELARSLAKWVKRQQAQKKSQIFVLLHPILTISFLSGFKMVHDTNGVHERAALCCYGFQGTPAGAALKDCMALLFKSQMCQKKGTGPLYWLVVELFVQDVHHK